MHLNYYSVKIDLYALWRAPSSYYRVCSKSVDKDDTKQFNPNDWVNNTMITCCSDKMFEADPKDNTGEQNW